MAVIKNDLQQFLWGGDGYYWHKGTTFFGICNTSTKKALLLLKIHPLHAPGNVS
jgi:hypothetical protein